MGFVFTCLGRHGLFEHMGERVSIVLGNKWSRSLGVDEYLRVSKTRNSCRPQHTNPVRYRAKSPQAVQWCWPLSHMAGTFVEQILSPGHTPWLNSIVGAKRGRFDSCCEPQKDKRRPICVRAVVAPALRTVCASLRGKIIPRTRMYRVRVLHSQKQSIRG